MSDELQLLIEKLVYGGDGLGHADGHTVFAPYVLPAEEIRAEITSRKKKLVWAKPLEILKANPARAKPVCPHFVVCSLVSCCAGRMPERRPHADRAPRGRSSVG